MNNLFGIGILLELKDKASERLRNLSGSLDSTERNAERTTRAFNVLDNVLQDNSGFRLTEDELQRLQSTLNGTSREAQRFERYMSRMSYRIGGEMSDDTRLAFATMQSLRMEMNHARRTYGAHSQEVMEARNRMTEFALAMDDSTFKTVYMSSQLGLNTAQLNQQANGIKLNARMTKLMGNQTEILTRRMQGLQAHGIKPEMMMPPKTIGQFQMLNETLAVGVSPLNRLSNGYRRMGNRMEGVIKKYSAQKVAIREANGDMVKYGLLLRGLTTGMANVQQAFLALGVGASLFYGALFKVAFSQNTALQTLADTTKGKVLKAFEPLISVASKFLEISMRIIGVVADWVAKFNEAHPIISKVASAIMFLLPAMTLLLLPLALGVGLFKGWMLVLNNLWTLFGGVATVIGTAASSFLGVAIAIGVVIGAITHLWRTNESFRNAVISAWNNIKSVAESVFKGITNLVTELTNAFKSDGIVGVIDVLQSKFTSLAKSFGNSFPQMVNKGVEAITGFVNAFAQKLPEIYAKGSEMLQTLLNGIISAIPSLINSATQILQAWVNMITTNIGLIINAGVRIVTTLLQGIVQALPSIINCAITLLNGFLQAFVDNVPLLLQAGVLLISNLIQGIAQAIPMIMEGAITIIQGLIQAINENLPMIMDCAILIINSLIQGFIENLPMFLELGMQLIGLIITGILTNLPMLIECGTQLILALVQAIIGQIPTLLMLGLQLVSSLASGLLSGIGQLIGSAITLIGQLISTIASNFGRFLQQGQQIVTNIANGIKGAVGSAIGAISSIISSIVSTAKGAVSKFVSIGSSIVSGLANGIRNGASAVISAVGGVVRNAINKAKSMLKINSPSKVFRSMGYSINEGLVQGVDNSSDDVVHSVESVADDTINTAEVSLNKDIMYNITPNVTMDNPFATSTQGGYTHNTIINKEYPQTHIINKEYPQTNNIITKETPQQVHNNNEFNYNIVVNAQPNEDVTTLAQRLYQEIKRLQQMDLTMNYNNVEPVF